MHTALPAIAPMRREVGIRQILGSQPIRPRTLAGCGCAAVQDDESEVESLLQRISNALLPEYRREAMGQLKDLLTDNPKVLFAPRQRPGSCCGCPPPPHVPGRVD